MSSHNYEYECMRADLLGLEQPPQPVLEEIPTVAADPEGLVLEGEQINSTSTKLDELNSIIDSTKKKLTRYQKPLWGQKDPLHHNRFVLDKEWDDVAKQMNKGFVGDLEAYCHLQKKGVRRVKNVCQRTQASNVCRKQEVGITVKEKSANCKSSDEPIEREVERQIDKLDSMIMKFERAELSLHQNNKLIKNIVKKKSSEADMDNEVMENDQ